MSVGPFVDVEIVFGLPPRDSLPKCDECGAVQGEQCRGGGPDANPRCPIRQQQDERTGALAMLRRDREEREMADALDRAERIIATSHNRETLKQAIAAAIVRRSRR